MSTRFVKPEPAAVTAYAESIGYKLDGEQFCDYYTSKGWLVGKSPMKDWQAAVRTWKRNASANLLFNPAAEKARSMAAKRGQLVDEEERYMEEQGQQFLALKSWQHSREKCPYGDPDENLRRFLSGCRDKFGGEFVGKLLAKYGRLTPVQPAAESGG
jgi:hypothetical protein